MAYVNKYNPGKLSLDLPSANYICELPLFSFGDNNGVVNLSFIFNYLSYLNNTNDFMMKPGYKLNLQKKVSFIDKYSENGVNRGRYINEQGKIIALEESYESIYFFDDKSQRTLFSNVSGCTVLFPDDSKETFNQDGCLFRIIKKDGCTECIYSYSGNKLSTITYNADKVVNITYDVLGRINKVAYSGMDVTFEYTSNSVRVIKAESEIVDFEVNGNTFTSKAGEINSSNGVDYRRAVKATINESTNSVRLSEIVYENETENEINYTNYSFPDTLDFDKIYNQVEITDYYGAKNRIQYNGETPMYSYEVKGNDVEFKDWGTMKRYAGTVHMLGKDPNSKNLHSVGTQSLRDGTSMLLNQINTADKTWRYEANSSHEAESGYYLLTGWGKVNDLFDNPESAVISVSNNSMGAGGYEIKLDLTPSNQWKYFSCLLHLEGYHINVSQQSSSQNFELKDLRLTFQDNVVLDDSGSYRLAVQEDGLFYHGGSSGIFMPLDECVVECQSYTDLYSDGSGVYFDDLLKNKINYKKGIRQNEFYFNNVTNIHLKEAGTDHKVTYNNTEYYLSQCYLAKRQYVRDYGYIISKIIDDSTEGFLVCETKSESGTLISKKILNDKLDVISFESDGIITEYTRDSVGRIVSEKVKNASQTELYERTTAYGTDGSGRPTVTLTDEFGNVTVNTLDSAWGVVIDTDMPDSRNITFEYDDEKAVVTKKHFSTGRYNSLGYLNGNLSSMQVGNLKYGLSYYGGEVSSVSKNNAVIEEHEYTKTSATGYYPSKSSSTFTEIFNYDKYGRLVSKSGNTTNEYDVISVFDSNGVRTVFDNNSSALLVTSTDDVVGETTRCEYDIKNRLTAKKTAKKTTLGDIIAYNSFAYDTKNRITQHIFVYDTTVEKCVKGEITYKKNASDITADDTVSAYRYYVNNVAKSYSANTFDAFNRVTKKTVVMGNGLFAKHFTYDKTRITGVSHKYNNQSVVDITQGYNCYGEIISTQYVSDSTKNVAYSYDLFGQLIREDNQPYGKTYKYTYDGIGNITNVKEYPYTTSSVTDDDVISDITFTYSSDVKDRLISYNGNQITYNTYGYVSSYKGYNYSWASRRLSGITKGNPRLTTGDFESTTFTYNGYGQRISKRYTFDSNMVIAGSPHPTYVTTYKYDDSGRLIREYCIQTYKGSSDTHTHELIYLYDESSVIGVMYGYDTSDLQTYYYVRNLQGDVIAILNASGSKVVEYAYDAYGNSKIVSCTNTNLGNYNPIRYRGYYLDRETGLYYLNARYYNPQWRRFISHDNAACLDPETINGLNLYAYCGNDPVNKYDPTGHFAIATAVAIGFWIGFGIGAVAGATAGGIIAYEYCVENDISGWGMAGLMTLGILGGGYIGGAIGGAIGSAVGYGVGIAFGGTQALVEGASIALYSGGGSSAAYNAAVASGKMLIRETFAAKTLTFAQTIYPILKLKPIYNTLWGKLSYDFALGASSAEIFLNGSGIYEKSIFYCYEIWALLERGVERIISYV